MLQDQHLKTVALSTSCQHPTASFLRKGQKHSCQGCGPGGPDVTVNRGDGSVSSMSRESGHWGGQNPTFLWHLHKVVQSCPNPEVMGSVKTTLIRVSTTHWIWFRLFPLFVRIWLGSLVLGWKYLFRGEEGSTELLQTNNRQYLSIQKLTWC